MCLPFWQSWTWHQWLLELEEQDPGLDRRKGVGVHAGWPNKNLLLRIFHLRWLVQIRKFLFIRMFKLQFSFVQTFIHVKHCYSINASLMSVLKQYIRIHYMQIILIFFSDDQRSINNSKPLEGGWRKRYHNPQYAFEQTPLMRYMHCFNP